MKRYYWMCLLFVGLTTVPAMEASADPVSTRQQVGELLEQLGKDSFKVREQATAALIARGPSVVPLVAAWANHRDPEVAYRVRDVLRRLQGTPGVAVEGLTLSAALVGSRPQRGQAVSFWLAIRNVSDHDIYLFRYMWDLNLRPVKPRTTARTVCATSPATTEVRDFYRLKPGETIGCMMDADLDTDVQDAAIGKVRLEVSLPEQARKAAPGAIFSGSEELVSGPIEMSFSDLPTAAEAPIVALVNALADGATNAEATLAASPDMLNAVRWGLCQAQARHRWRVFEFACRHPRAELEDAIVEFLSRHGARIRDENKQMKLLSAFAAALPPERKWPFYNRIAMAIAYDWRTLDNFVLSFSSTEDAGERTAAARLALRLHELGVRLSNGLSFLAWELFTTPDATLRNPAKALEVVQAGLELEPSPSLRLAAAAFANDSAAIRRILDQTTARDDQNNLAYEIFTRFPIGTLDPAWALELAGKAIQQTPEDDNLFPYFADTMAGAYAFKGDYREALKWQEKALAHVDDDDGERPGMAARVAYYAALLGGEPADRPRLAATFPPLKSLKARDAILARLNKEEDSAVRTTLQKLLKTCFPP